MPKRSGVGKAAAGPAELYCYCKGPDNGTPMVACDKCDQWFHVTCIELPPKITLDGVDLFLCGCDQTETDSKKPRAYKLVSGSENAGPSGAASGVAGGQASTSKEEPQGDGSDKNLVENNGRKLRTKKAHDRV